MKDYFLLAFRSISHRKLRSYLTILGIFIGIAAVVSLISISQGMELTIKEQFEKMGTDKLIITPGAGGGMSTGMGALSGDKLTSKDLDVVKKVKGVKIAAELTFGVASVEHDGETKQTFVMGLPTDSTSEIVKSMEGFEAEKGRDLKEGDRDKIMVGHNLAKEKGFFEKPVNLRDAIIIKGQEFKVVGIAKQIGNPQDDSQVYLTLDVAKELLNKKDEVTYVFVQIKEGFAPAEVAENIKKDLGEFRGEEEGKETFSVQTFEQLLSQVGVILGVVRAVLIGIAAISLLVGGIGIANTMYTSVLERTREIGIMKAIGAKNSDILFIFLIESGLLGITGGVIGTVLGVSMAKMAEFAALSAGVTMLKVSVTLSLIMGALAFSFIVGCASGVMPARHASHLKPVDALRYE